jgi:hypothetical protein
MPRCSSTMEIEMKLILSFGIIAGIVFSAEMEQGNSMTISCAVDTVSAHPTFKIDSILRSRMDTAATDTRLGVFISFQYPSDRSIMRITDSCNRNPVVCKGPDTVLAAYWRMLGDTLVSNYALYSSLSSDGMEGSKISDGATVYASKETILAISKECFISGLYAYPRQPQQWVGLRPSETQHLSSRRNGEVNLLGRRLLGPLSPGQRYFLPLVPE